MNSYLSQCIIDSFPQILKWKIVRLKTVFRKIIWIVNFRKSVESLVEPKWSSVEDRLTENNGNHDQDIRTVSPITQV